MTDLLAPDASHPPTLVKHCKKCDQDKPLSEFHNSARAKDGKWAYCKICSNARALSWYHEKRGCCGKCVRGVLCQRCNRILGNADDSIELLRALLRYVESHDQRDAA
jgi:hypothetical protein